MDSTQYGVSEIPTTQGKLILVDDENLERVLQHSWSAQQRKGNWYATSWVDGDFTYLHHFLFGEGEMDHRNGNGLDCRRENVRPATRTQNSQNRRPRVGCASEFKGVSVKGNRFRAIITLDGKRIFLGSFVDEVDAAKAYDKAAVELFGEFAKPNFPREEVLTS